MLRRGDTCYSALLFVSLCVRKAVSEGELEMSRGISVYGDRRVNEHRMGPSAGRREVRERESRSEGGRRRGEEERAGRARNEGAGLLGEYVRTCVVHTEVARNTCFVYDSASKSGLGGRDQAFIF